VTELNQQIIIHIDHLHHSIHKSNKKPLGEA
jgi:hypothetical protein